MEARLSQAIARIDVVRDGQTVKRGTGFLVAPNLVLTAFHVVAEAGAGEPRVASRIFLTFPTHSTEAAVVDGRWDWRADWILLRCVAPPAHVHPIPLAETVEDGAAWTTYGFSDANARDGMAFGGSVAHIAGTLDGEPAYQLFSREAAAGTGAPVKGLSGAPVVIDGAVAGVLRSALVRGQQTVAGTLYACPIELVFERCSDLLPVPDPCRGLPGFPSQPPPAAPYRFLDHFKARDAEIFFGRNREIRRLYDLLVEGDGTTVVLLYGQSGVGKSSFLDAGLLPRLRRAHQVLYVRRDRARGLLGTLIEAITAALPTKSAENAAIPSLTPPEALRSAWLGAESADGRPLIVLFDQIEEVFSTPLDAPGEFAAFVRALSVLFHPGSGPRGRLVLGFRKEWFAEVQQELEADGLRFTKVFLETLDRTAVVEIVTGLQRTKRLRERYGLHLEPRLEQAIAHDVTADRNSPVAPILQVLLSRMWRDAIAERPSAPAFSLALYEKTRREGFLLGDFLDQQLAALHVRATAAGRVDAVDSGLALDLLHYHTTSAAAAEQRSIDEIRREYAHRAPDAAWLVEQLKSLFVLSDPASEGEQEQKATRLSHDTLAPNVIARFNGSLAPGPRARKILENRASERVEADGTPLDPRDLGLVEQGVGGMRVLRPEERRLVDASRAARQAGERIARLRRRIAVAGAAAMLAIALVAGWFAMATRRERQWNDFLAFDASIPALLDKQPSAGLAAAVIAVDRSLELSGRVPPGVQTKLVSALETARERRSWTVPEEPDALALSADGRVATMVDGAISINDGHSGVLLQTLQLPARPENHFIDLAFSDDGEYLAATLGTNEVVVWARDGQRTTRRPPKTIGLAGGVTFVPGSHVLVATFFDWLGPRRAVDELYMSTLRALTEEFDKGFARLSAPTWVYSIDLDSTAAVPTTAKLADSGPVAAVAATRLSTGEVLIATGRHEVSVWTLNGRRVLGPLGEETLPNLYVPHAFKNRRAVYGSVDIEAYGDQFALLGANSVSLKVWYTSEGVAVDHAIEDGVTIPFDPLLREAAFGYRGRTIVATTETGRLRTFSLGGRSVLPDVQGGSGERVAVARGSELTVVAGRDLADPLGMHRIHVFDIVGTEIQPPLSARFGVWCGSDDHAIAWAHRHLLLGRVRFEPCGGEKLDETVQWSFAAAGGNASFNASQTRIAPRGWTLSSLGATPDGRVAAAFARDSIQIVEAERPERSIAVPFALSAGAVTQDGLELIVGSESGDVSTWDVRSGQRLRSWRAHDGAVSHVALDMSGSRFVTFASGSEPMYFWERSGRKIASIGQPDGEAFTAAAFHPDGTLFVGTSKGTIRHITSSGTLIAEVVNDLGDDAVRSFAVLPTGDTALIATDNELRAVDVASHVMLDWPRAFDFGMAIAAREDGRVFAAVGNDGAIRFWRANWREWLRAACERLRDREATMSGGQPAPAVAPGVDARTALSACARRVPDITPLFP